MRRGDGGQADRSPATGLFQNKQRNLIWDPSSPQDGPKTKPGTSGTHRGPRGNVPVASVPGTSIWGSVGVLEAPHLQPRRNSPERPEIAPSTRDKPLRCKQASWEGLGGHPNRREATGLQCGAYIRTSHPTRAVRRSSSLCWGQFLALKRATSSTPTDPQIEVSGTYATGTLPLGPLWVSDVPGLVLGPSFGLLGSQIKLRCLF